MTDPIVPSIATANGHVKLFSGGKAPPTPKGRSVAPPPRPRGERNGMPTVAPGGPPAAPAPATPPATQPTAPVGLASAPAALASVANGQADTPASSQGSRVSRVSRVPGGTHSLLGQLADFVADYVVLPPRGYLVVATWTAAAYLAERWDRFPHLAIMSPEKRSGKTRLLEVLEYVVPNPQLTTNISPAAMYRLIESKCPTLLLDEAQSMKRLGSESSEVIREMMNAGISRNAKAVRCGGSKMAELVEFSIYCPKVLALIGKLDGVLADRCLPIYMKRKTKNDVVKPYRSRKVKEEADQLGLGLADWATRKGEEIQGIYDNLEPFDIDNDRMAELLLPLQAVLQVEAPEALGQLRDYATELDAMDREAERQTPGVQLLVAIREIFQQAKKYERCPEGFTPTANLINELVWRTEEPWAKYNRDKDPITAVQVAKLLKQYDIESERAGPKQVRGYFKVQFEAMWASYCPAPEAVQ